jgi:hypothetical protein
MRFGLVVAAVAAFGLQGLPSQAQPRPEAPWCAVVNMGTGDIHWDCQYATFQDCVPNVLAGNRGFCNVNPYWQAQHPGQVPPPR